jgi:hypothetical protein
MRPPPPPPDFLLPCSLSCSAPEPAEPWPPRPKTTSPLSQSAPKPAFLSEGLPVARLEEDIGKRIEPQRAGALASFVAIQGNDLLKDASPPERRQPQGYITDRPGSFLATMSGYMPEQMQRTPPVQSPWERKPGDDGGPKTPNVSKPDTNSLLKRLRSIDPDQSRKYRQRSGQ